MKPVNVKLNNVGLVKAYFDMEFEISHWGKWLSLGWRLVENNSGELFVSVPRNPFITPEGEKKYKRTLYPPRPGDPKYNDLLRMDRLKELVVKAIYGTSEEEPPPPVEDENDVPF